MTITFNDIDEVVYPYIDPVREYLEAGAKADVSKFDYHQTVQAKDIVVSWTKSGETPDELTLTYSTNSDYSGGTEVSLDKNATEYAFKYLYKDTTYYVKVTMKKKKQSVTAETSFKTTDLGPRFLDVGGIYQNCRDLGGYKGINGDIIKYDMMIRGSCPDHSSDNSNSALTNEGYNLLNNVIGIKTQIDFRGTTEINNRKISSFSGAKYINVPISAYGECFSSSQSKLYKEVFQLFADQNNYPIYMHCAGGADRTGTVAILVLALLGASEDEIVQDYVVTTFSPVCAEQNPRNRANALTVINGLKSYKGSNLQEKCESFLSSIGLTKQEIYNIKAIMLGLNLEDYVQTKDYGVNVDSFFYDTSKGGNIELTLNDDFDGLKSVLIDDMEVKFSLLGRTITIGDEKLSKLSSGNHKVTIRFDGEHETSFTLQVDFYDLTGVIEVSELENSGDYTYVYVVANESVFDGVAYHFHTQKSTNFPDVEPNILINGKSVEELNNTYNLLKYNWTSAPGKDDSRHRVPVSILSTGNTMKLLINKEWLENYLSGSELRITLRGGFTYTINGKTYKILSDVSYVYTKEMWVKVV